MFWDPVSVRNHDSKYQSQVRSLQDQLAQATLTIQNLETELKHVQKANSTSLMDEIQEGHQKTELLRAKQDMMNHLIQMGEKNREMERNLKRIQLDEAVLVNDFKTVISKLGSVEQLDLIRGALKALETEAKKLDSYHHHQKSNSEKNGEKLSEDKFESVPLRPSYDGNFFNEGVADPGEVLELKRKITELEEENKNLSTNIEELDQQSAESIAKVLSVKEELQKKHQYLQKAYEDLYVESNTAQNKVKALQAKLEETTNNTTAKQKTISQSSQTEETNNKHADVQTEQKDVDRENENIGFPDVVKKVREILKDYPLESESHQTFFEAIAKSLVDEKWKKDVLERKVTELTRELKQSAEIKDALQLECDDMQTNIESLLLEIQHLKTNLPSIPEASEERVASLESETESLSEDIKRLQDENISLRQKNTELITSTHSMESSLRNQENLEAEVRNTKQQLDIAKQQLEGVSKNVESNENTMEDLSRRLHVSLEENTELRKKIDQLENSEKQMQDQLRMSMEKCKGLDDNIELIEELKLDLDNVRRELKSSVSNGKRLETMLSEMQESKHEMEKEMLTHERDSLKAQLIALNESNDTKEVIELREQLEIANRDKNDLEYDIAKMRTELDKAFDESDKLLQENQTLTREIESLYEQLTISRNEAREKTELLTTEMDLLQQEHEELKKELSNNKTELQNTLHKLQKTKEKLTKLESDLSHSASRIGELEVENKTLRMNANAAVELEQTLQSTEERLRLTEDDCNRIKHDLSDSKSHVQDLHVENEAIKNTNAELENELQSVKKRYHEAEDECERLKKELSSLRVEEAEVATLRENCTKLEKQLKHIKNVEEKLQIAESKCGELEAELEGLRSEKKKSETLSEVKISDNEKQQILEVLEEKMRENSMLKADNSKLMTSIADEQHKLNTLMESNKESSVMARETIENLSQLVREKDHEIENLKSNALSCNIPNGEVELFNSLKNERDELVKLIQAKHDESLQYHNEIQRLNQTVNEQNIALHKLAAEHEANLSLIKEKEAKILWAENELQVVRQRLKNFEESNNYGEYCNIAEHAAQLAKFGILDEKANALEAALIQEQSNNRMMQSQLMESQSKETNAAKELERLRAHLMEMEASYTEEALQAEDTRKQLEAKLAQAEERAKNSSTVYTSASIRANQQLETLQQQMALIVKQRDDIQGKLAVAEDKVLSHTASLTNLQLVLEQFQRDKEKDIQIATEKIRNQLHESYRKEEELMNEVTNLKDQLADAKECLQAASRLSEQLDKKDERIEHLTQEVARLSEIVNTAEERIQEANRNGEGKVDKSLVKNLLLGYICSPTTDKSSVLRVFATVLDFNDSERDKIGLNGPVSGTGWFSGLLSGAGPSTKDQEVSLSAAFVRFLESESKPKSQVPALPLAPAPLPRSGHSRQHSTSSTHSTILLSNVTLPTFPDFVPARNSGSILKEVLKDS
ncbi:thyroid receptor-interacting protein 11 isoform X2 [Orussus abietinus]|nr:thyroid receptor-interacting protein 11 isoform X2 [Orussus abietinus]